METYDHEGVELERCVDGHGFWLDRGELPVIVRSEQEARSPEERAIAAEQATRAPGAAILAEVGRNPRACPECGVAMQVTEYAASGIAIDECPEHGVWLDAGELEQIEAYGEAMRRQGTSSDPEIVVRGIQIPDHVLAGLSSAPAPSVPPPPT